MDAANLNTPGAKMYRGFDEETRDILKPLMSSKYVFRFYLKLYVHSCLSVKAGKRGHLGNNARK